MAYITKGIQFQIQHEANDSAALLVISGLAQAGTSFTELTNETVKVAVPAGLQEIGEVGMSATGANGYDQIEITTLADNKHMYMDGLEADGDNADNELTLKYLYDEKVFDAFNQLKDDEAEHDRNDWFYIQLPSGGFNVEAKISKVALDSVGVNAALTMGVTLSVKDISFGKIKAANV